MENILVPLDFSEESINALNVAQQLAQKGKAKIILFHTIEIPNYAASTSEVSNSYKTELIKTVKIKIDQVLVNEKIQIPEASINIEFGHPFSCILELIKKKKIDLMVMGSMGTRNWVGTSIGSTTEKVLRHSTCPTLIVKNKVNMHEVKDIAYANDLSGTPSFIVKALGELQALLGARLHIFKVITPNNWITDRAAKKQMEEFVKMYDLENYSLKIYNDNAAEDGIIHCAEDLNAELVAMAAHSKSDLPNLIIDHRVTERVVENYKGLVWACGIGDWSSQT